MLTAETKNHKIDGVLMALKTRKMKHQTIGILNSPKDVDDKIKLLETVSCKKARVYTIQCVSKYHDMVENS